MVKLPILFVLQIVWLTNCFGQEIISTNLDDFNLKTTFQPISIEMPEHSILVIENKNTGQKDTFPFGFGNSGQFEILCNDSMITIFETQNGSIYSAKFKNGEFEKCKNLRLPLRIHLHGILKEGRAYSGFDYKLLSADIISITQRCAVYGTNQETTATKKYKINLDKKLEEKPIEIKSYELPTKCNMTEFKNTILDVIN